MTNGTEITYDEAANIIGVSPRAVRDVLTRYKAPAIRYGYNRVRFALPDVLKVKQQRRADAIKAASKKGRK